MFPMLQKLRMSLSSFTTGRMVSLLVLPPGTSLPLVGVSVIGDTKVFPDHCQWHAGKVKHNTQSGHSTIM